MRSNPRQNITNKELVQPTTKPAQQTTKPDPSRSQMGNPKLEEHTWPELENTGENRPAIELEKGNNNLQKNRTATMKLPREINPELKISSKKNTHYQAEATKQNRNPGNKDLAEH
ncbi:Hypothetical predicted protein [Olea europaea subsp. europaea]|uniref:Uncharacterized protein n=1 Tax=Olea europaea subsp. europaea TaxID=158383 RepID=A0A8S0PSP0_OLEEU|nr:Hypothetical predicted protein [Olea europaea subsp. europaea]